jgi:D-aspartate ligase
MTKPEPGAVVCVGRSGLNALAIVRSLGRRGVPVRAVALRGSPEIASLSRYCTARTLVNGMSELYWALRRIGEGCERCPALFIDNDAMLKALAPNATSLARYFELVDPVRDAAQLTSKRFQLELAREIGLAVPRSWFPNEEADVIAIGRQAGARLIAKPLGPNTEFKVLIAEDGADLLRQLHAHGADAASVMVQEFIEGADGALYSGYGYGPVSGGAPVLFTSRKLRQNPPGAGVMAVGEPFDSPEVRELTMRIMRALDYRGMLSAEFKRDAASGRYYFIEWNARFDACHSLGWQAGYDAAYLAYRDRVHRDFRNDIGIHYDSGHAWINVECELRNLVRKPSAVFTGATWRPYLGKKEWAFFAADDPVPFFKAVSGTRRWLTNGLLKRLQPPSQHRYR